MIPSLEVLRQEQVEQRRRLWLLTLTAVASVAAGWAINLGFTLLNAAAIAGGH